MIARFVTVAFALIGSTAAVWADEGDVTLAAANALVRADGAAASAAGRPAMRLALQTLDRLGVHALNPADDPLPAWRRAARASSPPYRGPVLGPGFVRGWLAPGESTATTQQFLAGQPGHAAVAGSPAAPLDLTVSGSDNTVICGSGTVCRWSPLYTARYKITVRNGGTRNVRFYLVVD